MIKYDEFYQAKFISKREYCGFKYNKNYTIKVTDNKPYGVNLEVLGDDEFSTECHYCNINSIERVWKIKE